MYSRDCFRFGLRGGEQVNRNGRLCLVEIHEAVTSGETTHICLHHFILVHYT